MTATTVSCTFDKEAAWEKVRDRPAIVLDMNCWINMADGKSPTAARVLGKLKALVSGGRAFCPLSFGLICELHKQAEKSRLRVGAVMEELSLSVSYASREEIFDWEVERGVRRLLGAGPFDLSISGLYVPVVAYLTSSFRLEFPASFPADKVGECAAKVKARAESLTFTELLKMKARAGDSVFGFIKSGPAPGYSEEAARVRAEAKGDRAKVRRIEEAEVVYQYVLPALKRLPLPVIAMLAVRIEADGEDGLSAFIRELMPSLPAITNHIDVMATISQQPGQKFDLNDFFDFEIMPVPLAYASVFVAQDKGIRDVLRNRTKILERGPCRYCYDLAELEAWLAETGLG